MAKRKKRASLIEAEAQMERLLKRVGYKGTGGKAIHSIPDYRVKSNLPKTSDVVCANGSKGNRPRYTGDEILGIVTTHKSNLMPIRKDNKQAAIDAASMRRTQG